MGGEFESGLVRFGLNRVFSWIGFGFVAERKRFWVATI